GETELRQKPPVRGTVVRKPRCLPSSPRLGFAALPRTREGLCERQALAACVACGVVGQGGGGRRVERGKDEANGLHAFARGNPGGNRVGSVEKAGQGVCDGFVQRRLGYAESRIARANAAGLSCIFEK